MPTSPELRRHSESWSPKPTTTYFARTPAKKSLACSEMFSITADSISAWFRRSADTAASSGEA